jgi:hypothetical protein
MSDFEDESEDGKSKLPSPVGYKRPPVHTRFKPGQSAIHRAEPKAV